MMEGIGDSVDGGISTDSGDEPLFAFGRERRMHARAYDYWVSLLAGRRMPSVNDLDPAQLGNFAGHSVLIDLAGGERAPVVAFLGHALRAEACITSSHPVLDDVPAGSLLGELLHRLPDILAYRAPVGFEAEFVGRTGAPTLHRGILLPFAGDHGGLGAVYGVINWKQLALLNQAPDIVAAVDSALRLPPGPRTAPAWGDGPGAASADDEALATPSFDARLASAREYAQAIASPHGQHPAGLHAALGAAHDLLYAARTERRADLDPAAVVALVFGADLSRLERERYIANLAHAMRLGLGPGGLATLRDREPGGHRAIATAERRARRAADRSQRETAGRDWCARQPAIGHIALGPVDEDFLLLIGRRAGKGVDVVARVPSDGTLTGAALARFTPD
jgi:hypothetical protein